MNLFHFRSKYFRGKRIHGDYDIRVEQAEFKELSVNSSTETGVTASIILAKSGNKVVRSFKPDFLLVRQNVRDAEDDYRSILLGFQYGNIPSVNSLESIYNFQVSVKITPVVDELLCTKNASTSKVNGFYLKPW